MKITVIELLNPFNKNERNQYTVEHVQSIRDILDKKNIIEFNLPTICFVNNAPVLRKDWDNNNLKHGDTVVFASQMQGPAIAAIGTFFAELTVTEIVYGVLTVASIAAGIALQPPEISTGRQPDPTYSLNGANNQLRLNNPIEVAYGRNKLWPSYASRPFTRYLGNEQYLYQLLCLGQGEFDIEGVFIDDTNINDFLEIEYEIVEPNQPVTLIPPNVVTSVEVSNIELEGKTTFLISSITRGYPTIVTTYAAATHDVIVGDDVLFEGITGMPNQYYPVTAVTTTTITLDYDSTGLPAYTLGNVFSANWTAPFNANPSGTLATQLEVDLIHTTGIYYQDSKGGTWSLTASALFQYQEIDDTGTPIGAWTTLKNYNQAAYSLSPLRKTFTATVAAGRYRVRARRTNADSTSTRDQDTIAWGALRAVLEDTTDYGNVTLIAIKAKASNNLNSNSSNKVSCIATRKLPIYSGSVWSALTATRNPVWAFCDAVRADYGAKLADTYLDLTSLLSIATALDAEVIKFDWVFDQKSTLWEVLTVIARVAYGSPTIQGSIFSIIRDIERTLPSGVFNQENIVKGSLQWNVRLFEQGEYDSVEIEYIDETTWKAETVVCSVESSPEDNPEKIKLIGCMNRDKAYQYGLYLAAAKRYRRESITFSTGKEGLIPTFGDLISISHDVPRWGSGGYVVDINGLIIETSEPVSFGSGNHYIILRKKDGTATEPLLVTSGVDSNHVVLADALEDSFYFDDVNEPPFYHFGKADLWAKLAIVTSTKPNGKQVEIQAIPYDTRLYQFYEEVAPELGSTSETIEPALPVVTGLTVSELPSSLTQVLVSWNVADGAKAYVLERKSGDAENWETVVTTTNNSFVLTVEPIYLFLRVAGLNIGRGAWDEWEGDVGTTQFLPYDVNSVELVSSFVGDHVSIQWDSVTNATGYKVEVRQDSGATLIRTTNVLTPNFVYSIGDAIEDADINRNLQIRVYATNSNGDSAGYESIDVSNPIPTVPTGFVFVYSSETSSHVYYTLEWTANSESDIESYRVYGSATSGFTASGANLLATVQDTTATIQLTKSPKTKSISAISKATDAVITTTSAHGIDVGDFVEVTGVVGMTELNGNTYEVLAKTTNTLTIDVDSTGFTTYTSGGTVTTTNNYASTYYFKLSAKDLWGDDINATSQVEVTP